MTPAMKRAFAWALLACVLFIVVHPTFDLPDTTMRSKALTVLLFAFVLAFASVEILFGYASERLPWTRPVEAADVFRSTLSALRC
jgi:hypothetical protein